MTVRAATAALALCVAVLSPARVHEVPLDTVGPYATPYEGVWRMTPGGAVFALDAVPGRAGTYDMRMIFSPDLTIAPDTYFGTMTATADPAVYDASLLLDPSGTKGAKSMRRRRSFTVEFNTDANRMVFKPYSDKWTVNFNRILPYLFRFSVRRENTRPKGLDGAVRIAPDTDSPVGITIL